MSRAPVQERCQCLGRRGPRNHGLGYGAGRLVGARVPRRLGATPSLGEVSSGKILYASDEACRVGDRSGFPSSPRATAIPRPWTPGWSAAASARTPHRGVDPSAPAPGAGGGPHAPAAREGQRQVDARPTARDVVVEVGIEPRVAEVQLRARGRSGSRRGRMHRDRSDRRRYGSRAGPASDARPREHDRPAGGRAWRHGRNR